jgi:hypothetical protein
VPWGVELGEPYEAEYSELVAPARLADGTEAILKVQLPDDVEGEHEAERFDSGTGRARSSCSRTIQRSGRC